MVTTLALAQEQYLFEKYPEIKYAGHKDWRIYRKADRTHFTLTIPDFFSNTDTLTIQLTSFDINWDSSYIRIFRNSDQIQKIFEPMFFTDMNVPYDSIRAMDVDGNGLTDIKLLVPYMGNGLASLNQRVIYLFQRTDGLFHKVSYLDKMAAHIIERDFDGDNTFEILTMTLKGHELHNYWTYNIYHFINGDLINQNDRFGYPIMIQYLFRTNRKVTDKISPDNMKMFGDTQPEYYSKE